MNKPADPRTDYWNETYLKYWRERVKEADAAGRSDVQKGDARTEGDWVYERLFDTHPFRNGTVLDVGCAWGRMFPIYLERGMQVSGVDISPAMIEAARRNFDEVSAVRSLEVAVAEDLPFEDESFDNVVCVAVFDATYQHKALMEFLRVLKPSGRLYLTGKSTDYLKEDALALAAEKGAREKGHPNFFTDVPDMLAACEAAGCHVVDNYFFEKRGDFAEFTFDKDLSRPFYEWLIVLERGTSVPHLSEFSSKYSRTFQSVHPEEQAT